MVSELIRAGAELDEDSVQMAFWAAVQLVEAKPEGAPLSADVPRLLRHVFDADIRQLIGRGKATTNVTCMQPLVDGTGYDIINDDLAQLPLKEGRTCEGGVCCDECSRNHFPAFATAHEVEAFVAEVQQVITEPLHQFSIQKCAFRDMRTTLLFVRLVERMRRCISHEYGLPLACVAPLQTFVSCFIGKGDKQGGLHSDESTFAEFHYSCVLYLSTQHEDFEGGSFFWSDPPPDGGGARLETTLSPTKGSAVVFSSGWENMHEVEPLDSGTRFAVPSFFTTRPLEEVGESLGDDEAVAAELWRTLLMPEDLNDFREFMRQWHELLAA